MNSSIVIVVIVIIVIIIVIITTTTPTTTTNPPPQIIMLLSHPETAPALSSSAEVLHKLECINIMQPCHVTLSRDCGSSVIFCYLH